jgi:hypothetical protein
MADVQVVREDGHGEQTVLTLRIPDTAWSGRDTHVEVVRSEKRAAIPQQRTVRTAEELRAALRPSR